MQYRRMVVVAAILLAGDASAQNSAAAPFDNIPMRSWVSKVIDDSSLFRRNRAAAAVRRAPPAFRREFVRSLIPALKDGGEHQDRAVAAIGTLVNEGQLGVLLEDRGFDLIDAVPVIVQIAEERGNPRRRLAWFLLTRADSATRRSLLPVARTALRDPEAGIRWQAVDFLGHVRDSTDFAALVAACRDTDAGVRELALTRVARWKARGAIPTFVNALSDSDTDVRDAAIFGLGQAGPAAVAAVPALVALIADTSVGTATPQSVRANAAWALSAVLPRPDRDNKLQVEVRDAGAGIRSDGLGPYLHGADSVLVAKSAALNVDLGGPRGEGRATNLSFIRPLRRSLLIDLSHPAAGAKALAVVRDNEAVVHMAFTHVHERNMVSVNKLEPNDTLTSVERVEFQFRINGAAHLLQMGEWTQGEFTRFIPRVNGIGTTTARVAHPDASTWTVMAPDGSLARLWDLSDPDHPVDRGLYVVSFQFRWSLIDPP